jgi:hypothetical protein
MSEQKMDEKEMEKHDEKQEKSSEEKNWDEKYRRDPLGTMVWAVIFIWAGLVFLAANLGFLDNLIRWPMHMPGMGWMSRLAGAWPLVLLGAGVILLVEVFIRLLVPAYRRPIFGTLILGIIFISIALGDLVNWGVLWAVLLIGLGLSIILRGIRK